MADEYIVRGCEPSDYEAIHRILSHYDVTFNTLRTPLTSFFRREKWLAEVEPEYHLVAEHKKDNKVIGQCGIHTQKNPRLSHMAEINIAIDHSFHGKGVGSMLLKEAINLADNWLRITRLQLTVFTDNAAGIRLYEKFGFEKEGCCKQYAFRDGKYVDVVMMARIKDGS